MAAAGGSNFSATFQRLRQHINEHPNQQMGRITSLLRPPPPPAMEEAGKTDDRTLQLFPTRAGMPEGSEPQQEQAEVQAEAALTISYGGYVLAFKDFAADKAAKLIHLAGYWTTSQALEKGAPAGDVVLKPVAAQPSEKLVEAAARRKACMQRLAQKRTHRAAASHPYQRMAAANQATNGNAMNDEASASGQRL